MGHPRIPQGVALQKPSESVWPNGQARGPEEEAAERAQVSWDSSIPQARVQTEAHSPAGQCPWASSFTSPNPLPHLLIFREKRFICLARSWTLYVKYVT